MIFQNIIFTCGLLQFCVLFASAVVPFALHWKEDLACLPKLHRQMYWVYAGYIVLNIVSFSVISMVNAAEIVSGSLLGRYFCGYVALFWGVRLGLQPIFDVKDHLNTWWKQFGYGILTVLFSMFTICYILVAFRGVN